MPIGSAEKTLLNENLDMDLWPSEIDVYLWPAAELLHPVDHSEDLWHRGVQNPGAQVTLRGVESEPRSVTLSVRSTSDGWHGHWPRFSYAQRLPVPGQSGVALASQDALSEDGSVLTLLVLPGEKRVVSVTFAPVLQDGVRSGAYPFELALMDRTTGKELVIPGQLNLRHPQTTMLAYLPAIFSNLDSDRNSEDLLLGSSLFEDLPFFHRFLRGFEDGMGAIQRLLARMEYHFNPDTAPADILPWLASWVSLVLDDNWPELKRRQLIREAVELYRWRGTRRGLSRYIQIYTGVTPEINDQPFEGMRLRDARGSGEKTILGRRPDTLLGGVIDYTFTVAVCVDDPAGINEKTLRAIIEAEKPAHTAYQLRIIGRE